MRACVRINSLCTSCRTPTVNEHKEAEALHKAWAYIRTSRPQSLCNSTITCHCYSVREASGSNPEVTAQVLHTFFICSQHVKHRVRRIILSVIKGGGKVYPRKATKVQKGSKGVALLNVTLWGLTAGKETWHAMYRGLVSPSAIRDGCGKSRLHRDSISRPFSP